MGAFVTLGPMSDVPRLIDAAATGDPRAAADLLPLVYAELQALAAGRMAGERADHSLDSTALVHEAYLRLVGRARPYDWSGRGHFFAAAAEAMRRILVESARRKKRERHGGGRKKQSLADLELAAESPDEAVLAVNEALDRLAAANPRAAELVNLRFFAGLTGREAAAVLNISPRKADQVWAYARAWLLECLNDDSR
jgi:RNA polymerase sigma factor (TIGR02999 family)